MNKTKSVREHIYRSVLSLLMVLAVVFGSLSTSSRQVSAGDNSHIGQYKITIDYNGVSPYYSETWIPSGVRYGLPKAPVRSGYSFGGWKCGSKTYKASESFIVYQSMKFTAIWNCTCQHPGSSVTNKVILYSTCTSYGTMARVCGICKKELSRYAKPPLGHNYIIDDSRNIVSVKCLRCGKAYPGTVSTLKEFAHYHQAEGKELISYSSSEQNKIKALWIRYNCTSYKLDQATALKIVQNTDNKYASTVFNYNVNATRAANFFSALNKLSGKSYEAGGKTVYPFKVTETMAANIVLTGFSGFLALDRDIRNANEYKVFIKILDLLSNDGSFVGKVADYVKKIVEFYAGIANVAINKIYEGYAETDRQLIEMACEDATSFEELVNNIDVYYDRFLEGPFGSCAASAPVQHDHFVEYVIYRARMEYKEVFGREMDLKLK